MWLRFYWSKAQVASIVRQDGKQSRPQLTASSTTDPITILECDSIVESGFGFSTSIPQQTISDSQWEAIAVLQPPKSSVVSNTKTGNWGLLLGDAVQCGDVQCLKEVFDNHASMRTLSTPNTKLSIREIWSPEFCYPPTSTAFSHNNPGEGQVCV